MVIQDWLVQKGIAAEAYVPEEVLSQFMSAMELGLEGDASSIAMIPAYVGTTNTLPRNQTVAVIDAGGTNLRFCLVHVDASGHIEHSNFIKRPMVGIDAERSADYFYSVLTEVLAPLADQFDTIGFCFSYPATITPDFDGQLLRWTKEVKIPEMVGACVGAGLIAALEKLGVTGKRVVVLNDTVAALLAGVAKGRQFGASSYVGYILGTGSNTAYVEQNSQITKLDMGSVAHDGEQVINLESGGFAPRQRSIFDEELDAESEKPGSQQFEKMISGVYMGPLTLKVLKALAREGFLSDAGAELVIQMTAKDLALVHLSNCTEKNGLDYGALANTDFSEGDRAIIQSVFAAIVRRAALFSAVNIAAVVIKSGEGGSPEHPVCVNIDGSTYYKARGLADQAQDFLKGLLEPRGLHIHCVKVEDGPVVGAAIAAFTAYAEPLVDPRADLEMA